jgi:oligopeptide transport system ATP-binding protein
MADPLLEVRDLHVQFAGEYSLLDRFRGHSRDFLKAVDGVTLAVNRGEALGLVGESGCGKSTLARTIAGLYEPTSGAIVFDGVRLARKRQSALRRRIQMVFQDPYSSLNPRMTVEQAISEMLRVHQMVPRRQIETRCLELLHLVGLGPELRHAYPRHLSGGQRQRVSIARALALEPDILLADEPVSALDVSVQATVLNLLTELRKQLGLSLVLIAHNLAVVQHVCDRVHVMYLGQIVESATRSGIFHDARHPYTQGLIRAVPRLAPGRPSSAAAVQGDPPSPFRVPPGCRFHPRCPRAENICTITEPHLETGPGQPTHAAACHFAWTPGALGTRTPTARNGTNGLEAEGGAP